MADTPKEPFRVVLLHDVRERLKRWSTFAVGHGFTARYRTALEAIHAKLLFEPETWGDPQYPLRKIGLLVYHRLDAEFQLLYGMDKARKMVYLKDIKLRPGSWFANEGAT